MGGIPIADARGLETVLRGTKENARSDDALFVDAMRIFDLFYSGYGAKNPSVTSQDRSLALKGGAP
jgi:hypothetical protein